MGIGILILAAAAAASQAYGDWTLTYYSDGTSVAVTHNDGGSVLGTACEKGRCVGFIAPDIVCGEGHHYPALVNSPASAASIVMVCEKLESGMVYSFEMDDNITAALAVGGVIGFAFPMQSGEFKVGRFSLTGAAVATAKAMQYSNGRISAPEKQNTRDNFSL